MLARIKTYEWSDLKLRTRSLKFRAMRSKPSPRSPIRSGGHLVLGVQQQGDQFEIVGVLAVDKVQDDFLSCYWLARENQLSDDAMRRYGV